MSMEKENLRHACIFPWCLLFNPTILIMNISIPPLLMFIIYFSASTLIKVVGQVVDTLVVLNPTLQNHIFFLLNFIGKQVFFSFVNFSRIRMLEFEI